MKRLNLILNRLSAFVLGFSSTFVVVIMLRNLLQTVWGW